MKYIRKNQKLQTIVKEMHVMPDRKISYDILKTKLAGFEKWTSNKMRTREKVLLN